MIFKHTVLFICSAYCFQDIVRLVTLRAGVSAVRVDEVSNLAHLTFLSQQTPVQHFEIKIFSKDAFDRPLSGFLDKLGILRIVEPKLLIKRRFPRQRKNVIVNVARSEGFGRVVG
jgi:hypothetical protein